LLGVSIDVDTCSFLRLPLIDVDYLIKALIIDDI